MSSPIQQSQIYQAAISCIIETVDDPLVLKKITAQKVDKLSLQRFDSHKAYNQEDKELASSIADRMKIEEASPHYLIVLQAAHDFRIAYKKATKHEYKLFHFEEAPVTTLEPIEADAAVVANHTVMRHAARPASELINIAKAFKPNAVREVIPLKPERLVLHAITKNFVLNFRRKGELSDDLVNDVLPVATAFMKKHPNLVADVERHRRDVEAQAYQYLKSGKNEERDKGIGPLIEQLKERVVDGHGLDSDDLNRAIAQRAADLYVDDYIKKEVSAYDLATAFEEREYTRLPPQTNETRRIFMINGGVASGKSSSQKIQIERAKQEGVDWDDVLTINRDAFRPFLLKKDEVAPEHQKYFAAFAEDETTLIRDDLLAEYRKLMKENQAPHLYIDQVSPTLAMLNMAGTPGGRGLDLTIVQTPVENSFTMAYGRIQETGYYSTTTALLSSHSNVPAQLLKSLEQAQQAGNTNIRLNIVANVAKGDIRPVIMIDYAKMEGTINANERSRLLEFFRKTAINKKATKFGEIYQLAPPQENFQPMVDQLMHGVRLVPSPGKPGLG